MRTRKMRQKDVARLWWLLPIFASEVKQKRKGVTNMIVEPCCAERTLPDIMHRNEIVTWQTNGDVTLLHILKSVSWLAGDNLSMFLAVESVDKGMAEAIRWYFRRGWLRHLYILTKTRQADIASLLNGCDYEAASHKNLKTGMLSLSGKDGYVVVQGELIGRTDPGLRCYTSFFGNDGKIYADMTDATMSLYSVAMARKKRKEAKDGNTDRGDTPTA